MSNNAKRKVTFQKNLWLESLRIKFWLCSFCQGSSQSNFFLPRYSSKFLQLFQFAVQGWRLRLWLSVLWDVWSLVLVCWSLTFAYLLIGWQICCSSGSSTSICISYVGFFLCFPLLDEPINWRHQPVRKIINAYGNKNNVLIFDFFTIILFRCIELLSLCNMYVYMLIIK